MTPSALLPTLSKMDTLFFTAETAATTGKLLRDGALVVFPTETVYGLGADVFNDDACRRIFEAKGRPQDNPLITHIYKREQLAELTASLPEGAELLIEAFWPGPLTLVLPKSAKVGAVVTAGLDTLGVRMPSHPVARAFLEATGTPVAAPSANRSGKPSPTNFAMACEAMAGRVEAIIDGGNCDSGLESTVVAWNQPAESGGGWVILRPGSVTRADLSLVLGPLLLSPDSQPDESLAVRSPGTRHPHYKPRATVVLFSDPAELQYLPATMQESWAVIGLSGTTQLPFQGMMTRLYRDWKELSQHLYADFFELDAIGISGILVHLPPESTGIGEALRNRLLKASGGQMFSDLRFS